MNQSKVMAVSIEKIMKVHVAITCTTHAQVLGCALIGIPLYTCVVLLRIHRAYLSLEWNDEQTSNSKRNSKFNTSANGLRDSDIQCT